MNFVYDMRQDKETKGTVRFADGQGHNIYLRKEEAEKLGSPKAITVTIEPDNVAKSPD